MVSAQFLFGLGRRDGGRIPEAAWRRFLAEGITPRFPDGLTVLAGRGQWRRGDGRLLREPARIVLVVAPESPETLAALRAIRAEYQARFDQEGAGLVLSRGCALFR